MALITVFHTVVVQYWKQSFHHVVVHWTEFLDQVLVQMVFLTPLTVSVRCLQVSGKIRFQNTLGTQQACDSILVSRRGAEAESFMFGKLSSNVRVH